MTAREKNGPPEDPGKADKRRRLTPAELKRLVAEARKRGEPIDATVERLVVSAIDAVSEKLKEEEEGGLDSPK